MKCENLKKFIISTKHEKVLSNDSTIRTRSYGKKPNLKMETIICTYKPRLQKGPYFAMFLGFHSWQGILDFFICKKIKKYIYRNR